MFLAQDALPYIKDISLATALIVAVITLWRFVQAMLKKRDEDKVEVVGVHKLRADENEERNDKLIRLISNNTDAMSRVIDNNTKAMETMTKYVERLERNHVAKDA